MRQVFWRGLMLALVVSGAWASAASAAKGPALVGSVSNGTSLSGATAVAVSGNFAYSVSYWLGRLVVLDVTNPAAPTIVGSTASAVPMIATTNVTVSGHYAFVTSKNRNASVSSNDDGSGNSLTIVNISNPAAPTVTGTLQDPTNLFGAYDVAISGHYAFIASQGVLNAQPITPHTSAGSFSVIDITNPAGPTLVAHIDNASLTGAVANGLDHATSVAISGHVAFVTAFYASRLTAIDISSPTVPVAVTSLHDPSALRGPDDVVSNGGHAYVVNQTSSGFELAVVNIANPAAPTIAATLSDSHLRGAYRLRMRGNFVYVSANGAAAIAAVDVSNPRAPRLAGALTDSAHLANVTGLDVSSSGRYVIATSPHLASEAKAIFPPYPLQAGGPAATGTVSVIDLEPVPISVSIASASEPAKVTAKTSAKFSFAASDAVASFQCSLDHAALGQCSSSTTVSYGPLKRGSHAFTVQATDATGATAQASYTWKIDAATSVSVPPKITGTAQQGKKLTASTGTWSGSPAPTFSFGWLRCRANGIACTAISKQTKSTYKVTAADVGSRLEVRVTATNRVGAVNARSLGTRVVKWSSGRFARATFSHSRTAAPGLSLAVPSVGSGLVLRKLVISLPRGLAFTGSGPALSAGLTLKARSGASLRFKARIKHGALTITLSRPPTGAKLTLARGLVSVSPKLRRLIRSRAASLKLVVSLYYASKPMRRGKIKLRLA